MSNSKVEQNRKTTCGRKKGSPKTGGRKKGTPNKSSLKVGEILDSKKINLVEKMLEVAELADDWALKYNVYKELMKYVYPQRKALEVAADVRELPTININGVKI